MKKRKEILWNKRKEMLYEVFKYRNFDININIHSLTKIICKKLGVDEEELKIEIYGDFILKGTFEKAEAATTPKTYMVKCVRSWLVDKYTEINNDKGISYDDTIITKLIYDDVYVQHIISCEEKLIKKEDIKWYNEYMRPIKKEAKQLVQKFSKELSGLQYNVMDDYNIETNASAARKENISSPAFSQKLKRKQKRIIKKVKKHLQ